MTGNMRMHSQCLAVGVLVFVIISIYETVVWGNHMPPDYKRRIVACGTYSCCMLLWPLLYNCLVGTRLLMTNQMLWFAFVWPLVILSINASNSYRSRPSRMHAKPSTQMDVNAIAGFCFAVGGLISSQMGKEVAISTSSIFSTAFLMCLAFIMPTPEVHNDDVFSVVVETFQQSFLHMAIGLLIAGILINLNFGFRKSSKVHEAIASVMLDGGDASEGTVVKR